MIVDELRKVLEDGTPELKHYDILLNPWQNEALLKAAGKRALHYNRQIIGILDLKTLSVESP